VRSGAVIWCRKQLPRLQVMQSEVVRRMKEFMKCEGERVFAVKKKQEEEVISVRGKVFEFGGRKLLNDEMVGFCKD